MKYQKNILVLIVCACLLMWGVLAQYNGVKANEFEGNEAYWTRTCSGYISDASLRTKCQEYNTYIQNKINGANSNLSSLKDSIAKVEDDLSNLKEVSQQYAKLIAQAEEEVAALNESLAQIADSVAAVEASIAQKEETIAKRLKRIKERMVQMQGKVNTNQYIDYIMGATDLVDLVQRSSNVESFTKNDKEQIKLLKQEKKELEAEKEEKKRIQETLEIQQEDLKYKQKELAQLKESNDAMVEEYEEKVAEMLKAKNEAEAAANTLAALKPNFTITDGNADITPSTPSSGWIAPIQGSYITRGVDNAGHRGVDYAAGMGTPIVAPANCYVVFASNSYPNTGWLGNMTGIPAGGGNSVRIIFSVNGETFAMNLHHMMNNVPAMAYNGTGVMVPQGTLLGYVGSSGNSSGPHAHVELFKLNQTLPQAIATWYSTGDWQSSCGWGLYTPAYGSYGTRVDPRAYLG